jgi:hypothetical protein
VVSPENQDMSPQAKDAFVRLCQEVLPEWNRHLNLAVAQCQTAVQDLTQSFAALQAELVQLKGSAVVDRGSAQDRIFMSLQYQDKVSQMLALVQADMLNMKSLIEQPGVLPEQFDAAQWMAHLESRYVTTEQFDASAGNSAADGGDGDVQFY